MKSLTREQLIAGVLALVLTMGGVGYMFMKSSELADAAEQGRIERMNNLDLEPPKAG
jgi:hypothetical protein